VKDRGSGGGGEMYSRKFDSFDDAENALAVDVENNSKTYKKGKGGKRLGLVPCARVLPSFVAVFTGVINGVLNNSGINSNSNSNNNNNNSNRVMVHESVTRGFATILSEVNRAVEGVANGSKVGGSDAVDQKCAYAKHVVKIENLNTLINSLFTMNEVKIGIIKIIEPNPGSGNDDVDTDIKLLVKNVKKSVKIARNKYVNYMVETREFKPLFTLLNRLSRLLDNYDSRDVRIHLPKAEVLRLLRSGNSGIGSGSNSNEDGGRNSRSTYMRGSSTSRATLSTIGGQDGENTGWLNPNYFRHILLNVLHPRMIKHFNVLECGIDCLEGVWKEIIASLIEAVTKFTRIMENCYHMRFSVKPADLRKYGGEVVEGQGRNSNFVRAGAEEDGGEIKPTRRRGFSS